MKWTLFPVVGDQLSRLSTVNEVPAIERDVDTVVAVGLPPVPLVCVKYSDMFISLIPNSNIYLHGCYFRYAVICA